MTVPSRIARNTFTVFALLFIALVSAVADPVTGVVTNRTNGKPSGGDDVVLLRLAQGMQELARTKTDSKGRFSIEVPSDGLHLLRVTHDKANYFHPVQPGTQSVDIDVYSAAEKVRGIQLEADVMRLQADASGGGLRVIEHFFVKNDSEPATTLMNDHPFELYLPAGATVEGSAAKSPGGMAVQSPLVPETEPNKFTMIFPLRPGESEFQVTYKLPYNDSFTFHPRPVMATDSLVVMMPKSMSFKPGQSTPYATVAEDVGAQTYVARNAQPSQPLDFTVSGKGELPRDTAAGATSDPNAAAGGTQASAVGIGQSGDPARGTDPNLNRLPGKGIDNPLDNDAVRESWVSKYRWWIAAGLALLFAAGAGVLLRGPRQAGAAPVPYPPTPARGALEVLRDELFALETDRLEGKLTGPQYAELKGAFDVVLRRILARNPPAGSLATTVVAEERVPEPAISE